MQHRRENVQFSLSLNCSRPVELRIVVSEGYLKWDSECYDVTLRVQGITANNRPTLLCRHRTQAYVRPHCYIWRIVLCYQNDHYTIHIAWTGHQCTLLHCNLAPRRADAQALHFSLAPSSVKFAGFHKELPTTVYSAHVMTPVVCFFLRSPP